jgi:hypothetical protein
MIETGFSGKLPATRLARVVLPAPAGPSIAMILVNEFLRSPVRMESMISESESRDITGISLSFLR